MPRDEAALARRLAAIVGEEHVLTGPEASPFAVDGTRPRCVVQPGSQEEVSSVAAACAAAGAAMVPWGGGTGIGIGNPPRRADVVVGTLRLDRVVEFDDANLNVSVEAGVRLDHLQSILGEKKQFLPLDPPLGDRVTVGGLVQTNATGPGRYSYGTVRDWLLGLRVVLPGGERVRCGGKVIKNVSGYDLNKVFIGSMGTMGIVTEATFKLLPLPAARASVAGVFASVSDVAGVVGKTLESFLLPEAIEALDRQALSSVGSRLALAGAAPGYGLAVSLAGSRETVDRQVRDFTKLFEEGKALATGTLGTEPEVAAAWRSIRDVHREALQAGERVVFKIAVPIGKTLELFALAEGLAARLARPGVVTAHAGSGIVRAALAVEGGAPLAPLGAALEALRRDAEAVTGSLVLEEAPVALKESLDAWGKPRGGFSVMQRLKTEFDPGALMSPGRFLGGI